jgi:hypothetical protein
MIMQYARMFLCWSRAVRSGVNQGLYLFLVLNFLNGACLFKMVRKALYRATRHPLLMEWGQYHSKLPGPGRLERPACWNDLGSVWLWWGVVAWLQTHYGLMQWGSDCWDPGWRQRRRIWRAGWLGWYLWGCPCLGLYLVGSLIICVRFRASILDRRIAGVLSISQFSSPSSTNSEDRWGAINLHIVSRAQLGAEGG